MSKISDFIESIKLTDEKIKDINHVLVKAFVVSEEIEHIIDYFDSEKFIAIVIDAGVNIQTARQILKNIINEKTIKGGGLKYWIETHWHIMYDCVFSISRHKIPLEIMKQDHMNLLSLPVLTILRSHAFFDDLFNNENDINENNNYENINFEEEDRLEIKDLINLDIKIFETNNVFVYVNNNNFIGIIENNENNENNNNIKYEN
ncbi:3900_t:CDS:2 [Diversispora eburnea]|uniref:3900_t:CDS:1 n=1 Tax=Diversispora eburnea TaxID=1213867 RepID=A0A9N9FIE3_9GLOM|nr:3900_t:CDS:2 [Diversispora eburnea]